MLRLLLLIIAYVFPALSLSQSGLPLCQGADFSKWTDCQGVATFPSGMQYSGEWKQGKSHGLGILYSQSGEIALSGLWEADGLKNEYAIDERHFRFDKSMVQSFLSAASERQRLEAEADQRRRDEFERNRPPEQKTIFCIDSVRGGDRYGIGLKECAAACRSTYDQSMCSDAGRSGWQITGISARSSPPSDAAINLHSAYWGGACSCIGQNYVLTEIKALPEGNAASKSANREAELAKRERAIAEREKALLESENRRLKEELEALRKK